MTPEEMREAVPEAVLQVCQVLRAAGHQAWIVGGAVRDLVMGKVPSDWDVASDALPEAVLALFDKTIATGLQHGTVTAVVGRGAARENVEITTFRGEGAYTDARRPDSVHFGVPLDEDLKRRDFVINAMAYDPLDRAVYDPFGGVGDMQARVVRAVGHAEERFNEDGLRVMRAVRFVSTLDFELDPETEKGIGTALVPLGKVAQERVRVELLKLLAGAAAKRALQIAARSGALGVILPELSSASAAEAGVRVSLAPRDPVVRLAALFFGVKFEELEAILRRLTMSNEDRQRVIGMLREREGMPTDASDAHGLRRHLSAVGRRHAGEHLSLLAAEASRIGDPQRLEAISAAQEILDAGDAVALEVGELAIGGRQLMALGATGPQIGDTLRSLLDAVLAAPERNTEAQLLALAQAALPSEA